MFLWKNVPFCRELIFLTLLGSNALLCVKLVPKNNFICVCTFDKCFFTKNEANLTMSSVLKPMLVEGISSCIVLS